MQGRWKNCARIPSSALTVLGIKQRPDPISSWQKNGSRPLDDDDGGRGARVFLLAASEAGVPISVTCEVVQVAKSKTPFTWVDVTGDTTCTVEKAAGGIHPGDDRCANKA